MKTTISKYYQIIASKQQVNTIDSSFHLLLTTYYQLLTTYYQLPTTYHLPPTTYHLPHNHNNHLNPIRFFSFLASPCIARW
mgnify:FL=1